MILYDSVVSGSLVVSSSVTANAPLTISGSTASSGILFGSSFWQIASSGASLTYNGPTGYTFNAGTSNPYKFNFANNTLMQLTGSTGALMLQSSGSFVDNGYRLQVQTGASGSLWVSGSSVFSGSVSVVGDLTSTGTITAQTLVVQTITSSIEYSSGSNIFGSNTGNTHQFTGSVLVSGSQTVNGALTSGNVNIGAGGTEYPNGQLLFTNTTNGSYVGIGTQMLGAATMYFDHRATSNTGAFAFRNGTGGASTLMYIAGSGNVGIGTTAPQARTDSYYLGGANSNLGTNIVLGVGTDGGVVGTFTQIGLGYHNRNAGQFYPTIIASVIENSAGQNAEGIVFATRSATTGTTRPTECMRITSGGDVGIGTSSIYFGTANRKCLEVNGAGTAIVALKIQDVPQGYLYSIGNNADFYLARVGTGGQLIVQNNTGGVYLGVGTTAWSSISDIRLKNINSNIENALDSLMSLSTINFSWKSDSENKENLGLIAQEVESVFPQVISKSKFKGSADSQNTDETEYLGVRYTELVPVLIKAIQELKTELDKISGKI